MKINIAELKKKILYRANYRGTKEMDILLSSFVSKIIDNLDDKDLNKLLKFLENDDDTLYKMNQKLVKIPEASHNKIHKMFIGFKPE